MHRLLPFAAAFLASMIVVASSRPAVAQTELPTPAGDQAGAANRSATGAAAGTASREQISYALGLNIGRDLRTDEVDIDLKTLAAGIVDGFQGSRLKWTEEECVAAMRQFQQQMQRKLRAQHQEYAVKNKRQADAFLAKNKQRQGVVETASGLQYEVLESGNGPSPTRSDTVRVHYKGTLLNGEEFDSSYRRGEPFEPRVGGVIPGWTEALQKMHVGDKWRLFVPPHLAYGVEPPGPPIEPNSLLIFELELLGIVE